jgi:hypothetical protein
LFIVLTRCRCDGVTNEKAQPDQSEVINLRNHAMGLGAVQEVPRPEREAEGGETRYQEGRATEEEQQHPDAGQGHEHRLVLLPYTRRWTEEA